MSRWLGLMSSQAGLIGTPEGDCLVLKPKLLLETTEVASSFEFQIPSQTRFTFTLNNTAYECSAVDSPETRDAFYVDTVIGIMQPAVAGETVRVRLDAEWSTKKNVLKSQCVFDGSFVVPVELQTMGAPGYQIGIPQLGTFLYLTVGNIIRKETGTVEQLFLLANTVLIT